LGRTVRDYQTTGGEKKVGINLWNGRNGSVDLSSLTGGMSMPTDLGSAADLLGSLTGTGATAAAAPATTAALADEEADAEEEAPAPSPAETGTSG